MGLRDFIENMRYGGLGRTVDDFSQIFKESAEEFRQLKDEGRELFTDGAVEMLVKGNADYQTSKEKNEDAGKIVASAKVEYENAKSSHQLQVSRLDATLNNYQDVASELLVETLPKWKTAADSWGDLNLVQFMQEKRLTLRSISLTPIHDLGQLFKSRGLSGMTTSEPRPPKLSEVYAKVIPKLFPIAAMGIIGAVKQAARVKAANEYLEDAKDFKLQLREETTRLKEEEIQIEALILRVEEVQLLLNEFRKSLIIILGQIELPGNGDPLAGKNLNFARMSAISVTMIIKLLEDSLLDPSNDLLTTESSLKTDIKAIRELLSTSN